MERTTTDRLGKSSQPHALPLTDFRNKICQSRPECSAADKARWELGASHSEDSHLFGAIQMA